MYAVLMLISDILMTIFAARGLWFLHKRWRTPEGDLKNLYFQRIRFSIYAAAAFLFVSCVLRYLAAHYVAL